MDDCVYAFVRRPEQPVSFDHLEGLVHERRGIDRYLRAHAPGRVLERLFRRDAGKLVPGPVPEGAAGRGDDEPFDRPFVSLDALPDSRRLAVDGQDPAARGLSGCRDEATRHDQDLFVGKRDRFSGVQRVQGGPHPGVAHGGDHKEIDLRKAGHLARLNVLDPLGSRLGGAVAVARPELGYLLPEECRIAARREGHDVELVGKAADDVERLSSNGSRGAKNGQAFHSPALFANGGLKLQSILQTSIRRPGSEPGSRAGPGCRRGPGAASRNPSVRWPF